MSAHPATASSGFNGPGSFRLRAAIQAYPGRRLAADVIGRHAGPVNSDPTQPPLRTTAFETRFSDQGGGPPDLTISADRYHVDGIMIDATKPVPLDPVPSSTPTAPSVRRGGRRLDVPDAALCLPGPGERCPPTTLPFLVYAKVWDRLITAVEDPDILETALGPALPDTTGRAQVVWQVLPHQGQPLGLAAGSALEWA